MTTKYCPGCDEDKCMEKDFHKNKYAKDGLQGWCKECRANMTTPKPKEPKFNFQPIVVEVSHEQIGILPIGLSNQIG